MLERYGAHARVLPCDINQVFEVSGGLPLAKRAAQRQAYRLTELRRFSAYLGIALNPEPRHFPIPSDQAARLIHACAATEGPALRLAGAIGAAVWQRDLDISDAQVLATLCGEIGLAGSELLTLADSAGIRAAFVATTAMAIERGVFGAPTYILDGELFWGQDRLEFLDRALAARAT